MTQTSKPNIVAQINQIVKAIELKEEHIFIKTTGVEFPFFKGNEQYPSELPKKLADVIYEQFYCRGTNPNDDVHNIQQTQNHWQETKDFVQELSLANNSEVGFDRGWKVNENTAGGLISIEKNGYKRSALAGQYVSSTSLFSENSGQFIDLQTLKETFNYNNAFYFVFGQTQEFEENSFLVRFYFNLQAKGAAQLIQILTQELNTQLIPFQFKCLRHPSMYNRADSAVLYISKRYAETAFQILSDYENELNKWTNVGVPLFTLELMQGVGFAESPLQSHVSFGQSRSEVIAKAIILHKELSGEDQVKKVHEFIQNAGLNPATIWRNPRTYFPYQFI